MLLWRGFGFRWRFTSHRLPVLGSWLEDAPARHRFSLRIGAFPADTAHATAHGVHIEDPSILLLERGRTELAVSGHISWPATAVRDLPAPQPPPGHDLVAVLDGFQLQAQTSPAGWHFGGLGLAVQITEPAPSAEPTPILRVSAQLRPAESPHPGHFGLAPWTWNEPATHAVTVGWALLAVPHGRSRTLTSESAASHTLCHRQTAWDPSDPAPQRSETALLSGFDFALDTPPYLRQRSGYLRNLNGRYLRALHAGIDRRSGNDAPDIVLANDPHPIIRAGALLLQYLVLILSLAVLALVPGYRLLAGVVLLALALATRAWPSIWTQAPAVPFSVTTELRCVVLDTPSRAIRVHHRHVPDDDATSLSPP